MVPLSYDRPITEKGVRAFLTQSFITKRDRVIYPQFCEVRDSWTKTDFTASLGTVPQLQLVPFDTDDPDFAEFTDYRLEWDNLLARARFAIKRSIEHFDQVGIVRRLLSSLAARLANWGDALFISTLVAATTATTYENGRNGAASDINFFDASHDLGNGSGTQSNIVTGTTPATDYTGSTYVDPVTTAKKIQFDFTRAYTQLRSFVDDRGQPWHSQEILYEHLIILAPPAMEEALTIAFSSSFIQQTDNVAYRSKVKIMTNSYLTLAGGGAADWYLFYNPPGANRAFIYSRFQRIPESKIEDFTQQAVKLGRDYDQAYDMARDYAAWEVETNLGKRGLNADSDVILNQRFLMGVNWIGAFVPTIWQNCILVNNS